jgi:T5SS/PEP-CTERM-associated repeat protein
MSNRSNLTGRTSLVTSARVRVAAASVVMTIVAGSSVRATDYNFVGPVATPADYNIAANWNPAVVPLAADSGFIAGGRIAAISAGTDAISTLSVGANGSPGTGELRISGGSLTSSSIQLGHDAGTTTAGLITITGGSLTSGNVVMGEQGTGDNKIDISAGSLTLQNESYIGANGKGSIVVGGTAVANTKRLNVGNSPNSNGAITVSGGTLNVDGETYVGLRGLGAWTQTGGISNVKRVQIGQENDGPVGGPSGDGKGRGIVNVSGGSFISTDVIVVGEQSREDNQLNVSGTGIVTSTGDLYNGANGKGSITVSGGGTLNVANQMHLGAGGTGNGSLTVTGGNLNMTGPGGWILVGQNGVGTFTFSGGAIDTKIISVGQDPSGSGTATQTGGAIRSQGTFIVGEATLSNNVYNMSAGTADIGTLGLDNDGAGIFVGSYHGKGTFSLSGTAAVSVRNGITVGYGEGGASDGTINVATGSSLTTVNSGDDGRARIGVYTGSTGKLNVNGGTVSFGGPILNGVARGGVGVGGTGIVTVNSGSLTAASMLNETGSSFNQIGGTSTLGVVTGGGSISVSGGTTNVTRLTQSGLTIVGVGTLKIANAAVPAASTVSTLTTGGTGKLDITNNGLIVDYTGATSPIDSIRQALLAGRIVATLTPADPRKAVGYGEAGPSNTANLAVVGGAFMGTPVDTTAVVLLSRLKGDANMDGTVEFQDLVVLAHHYDTGNRTWTQADFDYDGDVDFQDLVSLAQNYNLSANVGDIGTAEFQADWALAQSLVPEPTSLIVLSAGATLAVRRRRFA